jgi:hypothetical protein
LLWQWRKSKKGFCMKNVPFVLAICIAALTASSSARAETIFLKCEPFTSVFTVDLTNKTVDNDPASITPTSIDWENRGGAFVVHHHIDRTAGTLTSEHHGQRFAPHACKTVKKPATKF